MKHKHSVYDTDAHFLINPFTRVIKNESTSKVAVIQHDHNSERFTFEIPRRVDGHDMSVCDRVEVHYINMDATNEENISADIYEVDDLQVSPDDRNFVICSWLLSQNATKYAGSLNFLVRFICLDEGKVAYAWHTAVFTGISVSSGILNNAEEIIEPFPDVLAQWKADLFGVGDTEEQRLLTVSAEQQAAIAAKGQAVLDSIPDEYEALQAQADENTRIKAGAIVLDAEGESIVVNDASDFPMMGLKVFGKSTQDGSPTPDAPVDIASAVVSEIVAFGGNLIPYPYRDGTSKTMNGITYTVNKDGSILVNGTATGNSNFTMAVSSDVRKLPKGWVSTSLGIGFGSDIVQIQNDIFQDGVYLTTIQNQTEKSAKRFFETNVEYRGSRIKVASGVTVNNVLVYPVFCCSENAIPYEPGAKKQTAVLSHTLPGIPVTSGGNYTDANGQQWICDEVDLARGVYVQRVAHIVVDETSDVRMNVATDGKTNGYPYRYFLNLNNIMVNPESIMCDRLAYKNVNALVGNSPENEGITVSPVYSCIYLNLNQHMTEDTVDECKAALANYPLTVNHVLATPIETPLTDAEINAFKALHSNKPNTTILNDAGAFMAVEYVADTKTYIDNKISEMLKGSEQT